MIGRVSSRLTDNFPTASQRHRNPDTCCETRVRFEVVAGSEALLNGQRTLSRFAWSKRAKDAEEARRAIDTSPQSPELVERFYNAVEAAYPPGFWEHYGRLEKRRRARCGNGHRVSRSRPVVLSLRLYQDECRKITKARSLAETAGSPTGEGLVKNRR